MLFDDDVDDDDNGGGDDDDDDDGFRGQKEQDNANQRMNTRMQFLSPLISIRCVKACSSVKTYADD